MLHKLHIQDPVTAKGPKSACLVMIEILHHYDLLARHPRHFLKKSFRIRHMMEHGHKNRHIITFIRERDPGTVIKHHGSLLITGLHNIQHQMLVPPLFKRPRVKPPSTPKIQDPASPGDLIFKKPNDLFRPGLESTVGEIPDDPVQYPTLKELQAFLNGDPILDRYGF